MSEQEQRVSLTNLGHGAVAEMFDAELARVLHNIADRNTRLKFAREITLKVKIVPGKERDLGNVKVICTSKLAPMDELDIALELVQEGRNQVAYELGGKQPELPFGNVTNMGAKNA